MHPKLWQTAAGIWAGSLFLAFFLVNLNPDFINDGQRWFEPVPEMYGLIAAGAILVFLARQSWLKEAATPLGLCAGGLLANLSSLLIYDRVIDYLPLPTTMANVPDLAITIGVIWIVVLLLQQPKKPR